MVNLKTTYYLQLEKKLAARDWLETHLSQVQAEYSGKWIACTGDRVVTWGETPQKAKEKLPGGVSPLEVLIMRVPVGEVSKPI